MPPILETAFLLELDLLAAVVVLGMLVRVYHVKATLVLVDACCRAWLDRFPPSVCG
jgi:hypothetical protein